MQHRMRAIYDVFQLRKALQKTFSTGCVGFLETPASFLKTLHSIFVDVSFAWMAQKLSRRFGPYLNLALSKKEGE